MPGWVALWPLFPICVGSQSLVGWPGWTQDLSDALPGIGWLLIGGGLILLPFTTGFVDKRLIVGPLILIGMGLLLIWRRKARVATQGGAPTSRAERYAQSQ